MNTTLSLDDITKLRLHASNPNSLALGYPVNREHTFAIDVSLLGINANSMSTTYLNNIASPYSHGSYTTDHIKDIEIKLMALLGQHLGVDVEEIFGYTTCGGTEANFVSIWWHRNYLIRYNNETPILICSSRNHYSFRKIADQLNIELIEINANYAGMDYNQIEDVLKNTNKPIIFAASFGATVDGCIDNIFLIKSLLDKYVPNKYKIHGDGAIYGIVIPFLKEYYKITSIFDFIDTLSMSGHKFLGAYNISGVVLSKQSYLAEVFFDKKIEIKVVENTLDMTASGSRQGLFSLELYLLVEQAMKYSSVDPTKTNLEVLWNECLSTAHIFYSEIAAIVGKDHPLLQYNNYQLSILIPAPVNKEQKLYLGKKYGLMPVEDSQYGMYIFPRSTRDKLDQFLSDYAKIMCS